jgi:Ca2+-binding EF-hand superfamily protein
MEEACKVIGYTRDPTTLFKHLLDGPGKVSISMGDIDPAAMRAFYRGDLDAMNPIEKARAEIAARQQAEADENGKRMNATDWISLRKILVRKWGTILAAWRGGLDVNASGKLGLVDFSKQVRGLGFSGNIKKVFASLDLDKNGVLTFDEVEPQWYARLKEFNDCMLAKHTSYEDAWKMLDKNHCMTAELDQFVPYCEEIGYSGDPKALFKQLLKDTSVHCLALADLEAKDPILYCPGHEPAASRKLMRMNTDSLSTQDQAKQMILKRESTQNLEKSQRMGAGNWSDFKARLIHRYGTITAAFRHGLDVHGNGRLSFAEFSHACQNHSFEGNIKECFKELDADGSGVITFNKVDADWFRRFETFNELLIHRDKTIEKAFALMDKAKKKVVDVDDFSKYCADIGYGENPKALFKQLLVDTSRHLLHPEDLDVGIKLVQKSQNALNSPKGGGFASMKQGWTSKPTKIRRPSASPPPIRNSVAA